jgi:hypothetical protein
VSRRLGLALVAVAVAGALAAAAGIPVRASEHARTTGDEPHYLVTALSLAEDGALDVRDELAQDRYRPFHEIPLGPQARARPDGVLVEPHEPLLPAFLAGPMAAAGWAGAKAALALLAGALAALLLWTAVVRLGVPLGRAFPVVLVFAASAPFAVYGQQVYPELPAALAVTVAVAALLGPFGRGSLAAFAVALVALPWLSTKYAVLSAALVALALARLLAERRGREALALGGWLALGAGTFLAAHHALYGGWTPYAAGEHFTGGELSVVGSDPDYGGRSLRLLGLLVDREFGLIAWQPVWLLAVPALAALARARPPGWATLALPLAAGWVVATWLAATMHGWWWPGRHVVAVLPLAVLALAWWAGRSLGRTAATVGLGALGVLTYAWTTAEGWLGELDWVVDFAQTENPVYALWREALPDYTELDGRTWALQGAWIAVLLGLAILGRLGFRKPTTEPITMATCSASSPSSWPLSRSRPPRTPHRSSAWIPGTRAPPT